MTPFVPILLACALFLVPAGTAKNRLAAVGAAAEIPRRWRWNRSRASPDDPMALAAGWDLLATGLRSGLAVPVIVRAVANEVGGESSRVLREVADLLSLGADPVAAWEPALRHASTAELGRAARRTARSGTALAAVAADTATRARAVVGEHAQARAHRAGVWVAAPLGLCFLPAFLCLGVVPIVVGMTQQLTVPW